MLHAVNKNGHVASVSYTYMLAAQMLIFALFIRRHLRKYGEANKTPVNYSELSKLTSDL